VIFAASSVALLMGSIDATIVATALSTLTREMGSSLAWTSWTINAYLLGQTLAMPIAGRLSDSWGRRRMFLVFVATFTVASLMCGLAMNVAWLIVFRFIQALGGGGFMPSAMGIVAERFGRDRDRAIGLFSSIFPIGALVGPALGGLIVTYWPWRVIFFINVPVGIALIVLLARLLPPSRASGAPAIDPLGAVLLSGTLLGLMVGLHQLGEQGAGSPLPWALLAAGAISAAAFVARQSRTRFPIIAPALLRRRAFAVINGLNLLYGASALGVFSFVPLFAQAAYHLTPLQSGTLLTVRALGMMLVALVLSMAIRRTGYRVPMVAGFALVALGLALMSIPPAGMSAYAWMGAAALSCGLGVGVAGPASNNAAIDLLPDQVAAISGLRGMFRQVGGIVAVSVVTLLVAQGTNPAHVLPRTFAGLALIAIAATPIIVLGVPERRREPRSDTSASDGGAYRAAQTSRSERR
jgi:EmrB/QacA subfamily drug resistance transporter